MTETLDIRRRKARFRSWHRGMREADLIMGGFADAHIESLDEADLGLYEALLDVPDADLIRWVTGELPVPAAEDTPLFRRIAAHARSVRT
jgi:antitoxin CptB